MTSDSDSDVTRVCVHGKRASTCSGIDQVFSVDAGVSDVVEVDAGNDARRQREDVLQVYEDTNLSPLQGPQTRMNRFMCMSDK